VGASVHPQAQQILDGKAASGAPPLWELTPDEARAGVEANNATIPAGPDLESVRDIVIPSQAGGMPARVYSPSESAPGLVVYFHGGGWVAGSVDGWDSSVRTLAVASGCQWSTGTTGRRFTGSSRSPACSTTPTRRCPRPAPPSGPPWTRSANDQQLMVDTFSSWRHHAR